MKRTTTISALIGAGLTGAASAQTDVAAGLHNSSETWTTAGSPYRLKGQVYFTSGATLTIDAGVVVASDPNDQGSLAICRGAQIFVNGTAANPVIMTSSYDVATWVGGDPKTGCWREAANEWGNLTIMGNAYISEDAIPGNTQFPSASNVATMEGLQNGPTTDRYGGGNDNDDSGTINYLSVRYGGRVIGLGNELNGLSLGGIGRGTDIDNVEVMNNIDDGIEVWGGTVNFKHVSIWNIGDDSFDIDQGWRGQAQFGLIVQGYSIDAGQGGGVGDNCFETDGAENSYYQPVTTGQVYNFTVIGQPTGNPADGSHGDHGTAWRDNARMQYRNCIFMDLGERVVSFDNVDGDGGAGYGASGGSPITATLTWPQTWTTAYNAVPAHPNDFPTGTYATNYASQNSGNLAEIKNTVFYNNNHATAYTEANARGVTNYPTVNSFGTNVVATVSPITSITRNAQVIKGGLGMNPVATLDPRPANDALSAPAPYSNGFYDTSATYCGAFAPSPTPNWLLGWSAADAYGFLQTTPPSVAPVVYCTAGTTTNGCVPHIFGFGTPSASSGHGFDIVVTRVEEQKQGLIFYGLTGQSALPWGSGSSFLCVKAPTQRTPIQNSLGETFNAGKCDGVLCVDFNEYISSHSALGTPFSGNGTEVVHAQAWFRDPPSPKTTNLSDALQFTVDP